MLVSTPDNGLDEAATTWLQTHAPGAAVAVTSGGQEMALNGSTLRIHRVERAQVMATEHVRYVVLQDKVVGQGYSWISPRSSKWLSQHGRTVFSFAGRTFGTTRIVEATAPKLW